MSNSSLVDITVLSPNCNKPRNHKIDTITIHHCSGVISVENLGRLFANPGRRASSNYGIDSDGRVGLYVDEENRSWCSSSSANDNRAITIEVSNNVNAEPWSISEKAYAKLIDLVTDICKRNGIDKLTYTGDTAGNLTRHCFFADTDCPGTWIKEHTAEIVAEVNRRLGAAPAPTPGPEPGLSVVYQAWCSGAWLPLVCKADDTPDGYAGLNGIPIRGFRCRISDWEALHYQARRLNGRWFNECDHWGDTGNGYAGNKKDNIDYIMVWSESGKQVAYRVRTGNRWLPWVYKANKNDPVKGMAGNAGQAITGIQIKLY